MIDLNGRFLRGALWDGNFIYLVEANQKVFQIYPWCDAPFGDPDEIFRVTGSGALVNCQARSFKEVESGLLVQDDTEHIVKTYQLTTAKGICVISCKWPELCENTGMSVREFEGLPPNGTRRLTDF